MRRLLFLPIAALGLIVLLSPARADDKESVLADELRLKNAFQKTDGTSLVSFLRTRADGEATPEKLTELIDSLESKSLAERQKACGELVAVGSPAIPSLREAARRVDSPDSSALARRCLKALETEPGLLSIAAVRILAARRPAGTAEALLAYLPHAENDSVAEELKAALAGVAYDKGKADPAVLKALGDEHPLRRASAIVALCQSGIAEPRATLRKLLLDPAASVRLRASLALAQASDAKAVSTLIALLPDLPTAQAQEVESFLTELAGDQAPKVQVGADDVSKQKSRDEWAKWWLASEGPELLQELTKRTLTESQTNQAQALIEKLGDESFETRQQAQNELKKMGATIIPLLRHALKHADLEVRNRSRECLTTIEADKTVPLSPVTARLIALRKPKGAAEALLAYLPFAEDDTLLDELQLALNMVAYPGGKAHPALVKSLIDKNPVRRAASASALCNGPMSDHLPLILRLLKDKDAIVRLKVALALAGAREQAAVPALISLVGELPPDGSAAAEEYLVKLARDTGPKNLPDGESSDILKKRSAAWDKWWADNKSRVVMVDRFAPAVRERFLGNTLMIQANNNQIEERDKDNKVLWTMTGLFNPWDAQILPGKRVLVTEYNGQRVTERNFKGEILWEKKVPSWPMSAERLKNGQTFIVCRNLLLLVDRGGREILKIERGHDIMSARRLANGQMVVVTSNRQILRLDRTGKQLKATTIPNVFYNQNEILNNGNVLVPLGWNNRLIEYNSDGKEVWSANTPQPMHAVRLPNGNTLVASQNWPYKTHELDKTGKQVAETLTNIYVFRVRRR
jgi:HEAT repeat protein